MREIGDNVPHERCDHGQGSRAGTLAQSIGDDVVECAFLARKTAAPARARRTRPAERPSAHDWPGCGRGVRRLETFLAFRLLWPGSILHLLRASRWSDCDNEPDEVQALELHLRRGLNGCSFGFLEVEELLRTESHRLSEQHGREALARGIVFRRRVVEKAPRRCDLILEIR